MEIIFSQLPLAFGFSFLIYIWSDTEAFIEYCSLMNVDLLYSEEYLKRKKDIPSLDYLSFLQFEKSSFLIRLVTCPVCLSFWLNAFSLIGFWATNISPYSFFVNAYCTVLFYYILKKATSLANQ